MTPLGDQSGPKPSANDEWWSGTRSRQTLVFTEASCRIRRSGVAPISLRSRTHSVLRPFWMFQLTMLILRESSARDAMLRSLSRSAIQAAVSGAGSAATRTGAAGCVEQLASTSNVL
jgi:hypothetical protein